MGFVRVAALWPLLAVQFLPSILGRQHGFDRPGPHLKLQKFHLVHRQLPLSLLPLL